MAWRPTCPSLLQAARLRPHAFLVQVDQQDAGILQKYVLGAVAVVHIPVQYQNLQGGAL